ncbi:MAG TPA: DUF5996 family protein [Gemmatimonadaceae bacterium]|jgi:hypothetical protein|nr:DUF5996 family protein [Gemmatimonadaceae bacterium]
MMVATIEAWPALPLDVWRETYETLHMWTQIVGKTRLALSPMENHWWNVALYVTPRGLTTSAMPSGNRTASVDFDFIDHELVIRTSDGATRSLRLAPRSVADFYREYASALGELDLAVRMRPVPVEVEVATPFAEDTRHASYDAASARRFWRVLAQADRVMKRFRARFIGKSSPVHFFWGSFDHAATRYSGRAAPRHPGGAPNCPDYVMYEAYSHECSSCGFWPGGGAVTEPMFYAYAYPEPDGFKDHPVRPEGAYYSDTLREFVLPYERVRSAASPDDALLDFLQSTYEAAAVRGGWNREALERSVDGM